MLDIALWTKISVTHSHTYFLPLSSARANVPAHSRGSVVELGLDSCRCRSGKSCLRCPERWILFLPNYCSNFWLQPNILNAQSCWVVPTQKGQVSGQESGARVTDKCNDFIWHRCLGSSHCCCSWWKCVLLEPPVPLLITATANLMGSEWTNSACWGHKSSKQITPKGQSPICLKVCFVSLKKHRDRNHLDF